ncbi:probable glutamate--tRNA ligase, mitochondrial [Biomphalaria glabrata]|uniref:Nondiscriminating glutamyl-tRNA synthetase EARS2, mitochondrial n=1 Tax=Biomphalaria glabrata TaxID=6526 RepID=A0A9W2Z8T7_BIOGL|nr:probable glutamate--tRNA ligase, mitochondrial [Biomphalaria glabrata]
MAAPIIKTLQKNSPKTFKILCSIIKRNPVLIKCRKFSVDQLENTVRVRFAPSPTGYLHLGGLRTALYNYLFAHAQKGKFILRIEDTDQSRAIPGAIEKLEETLHWAGLDPDEGPTPGGSFGPYIQSQRLSIYQENIKTLLDNGWAYPCFCTSRRLELMRKEAAKNNEPSKYDNRCRSVTRKEVEELIDQGTPYVIRLKLEPTPDPWDDMIKGPTSHNIIDIEGDPVLMKSDGYPTYHFANVVDDHLMKVSHVLRGSEWLSSTPKHILLYKAFGWSPPKFGHLPLIVNHDGTKLSKRQGDIHVEHYRELGCFPQSVLNFITTIGGGFDKYSAGRSLQDMWESFDISKIKSNPGKLSPTSLNEANRSQIEAMVNSSDSHIVSRLADQVRKLVVIKFNDRLENTKLREQVLSDSYIINTIKWSLMDARTSFLSDFVTQEMEYLWVTPSRSSLLELAATDANLMSLLRDFEKWVTQLTDFSISHLGNVLKQQAQKQQLKPQKYFTTIRQVLTGLKQGAPVAELMSVIGRDNVLARLDVAIKTLQSSALCAQASSGNCSEKH